MHYCHNVLMKKLSINLHHLILMMLQSINQETKKILKDSKTYPFPPQREYPDLPKPADSQLLKKDDSIIKLQFNELNNYIEYLEKLVEDYKKSIEERDKKVFNEKYHVIENFFELGGKNTNDLLVYIMTAVFILLLVDYIFKMGKNSY